MSTVSQVMSALKKKGNPQRRELFKHHGAKDRLFGVSVADMKVIAKTIKGEQELACELYGTGNYDAMYLAGMVADGKQMTKKLGKVSVDMHGSSCKVPVALDTITKIVGMGRAGKKRKTIRC